MPIETGKEVSEAVHGRVVRVLREGAYRRTEVVECPSGRFVVKRFFPRSRWRRVFGSSADHEIEQARACAERGVSVPHAHGSAPGLGGHGAAVFEFLESAHTVRRALFEDAYHLCRTPHQRRLFTADFARWLRQLCDAGIAHGDLHLENVMVRRAPAGFIFSLVDFRGVALVSPRRARRSLRRHLSWLTHLAPPWVTPMDRLRFLRHACPHLKNRRETRRMLARLERAGRSMLRRFRRRRRRKFLVPGRRFRLLEVHGHRGLARADLDMEGALSPAALLAGSDSHTRETLKDSRGALTVRLRGDDGNQAAGNHGVVLKQYRRRGLRDTLRRVFGMGRARRAWVRLNGLAQWGIACPRPLFFAQRRLLRRGPPEVLATEFIEGSALDASLERARGPAEIQAALSAVARVIRGLHDAGFSHRDLKPANILVAKDERAPGGVRAFVLDPDGIRDGMFPRRTKNLARLARSLLPIVGRTGVMRLVFAYCRTGYPRREDARRTLARVFRLSGFRA